MERFEFVSAGAAGGRHRGSAGRGGPPFSPPRRHRRPLAPQIRDLGSGNFGVAKLMRERATNELVAVKFIERGSRVSRRGPE
jgi:serine/threonine-protein kinase SRK2